MIQIKDLQSLGFEGIKDSGREISAKCLMHNDDTPSFSINKYTEAYQCFAGCMGGFGLENLAKELGKKVLVECESDFEQLRKKLNGRKVEYKSLPSIPILSLALCNNEGHRFIEKRGFDGNDVTKWNLMYWEEEKAIVIPCETGFILRFLDKNIKPKYKYIYGTKITDTLFGLDKLNNETSFIILVEGSFDVIWLHKIGFNNSLGLLHSSISDSQLKIIQGISSCIYLMLDNDEGGNNAVEKIKERLQSINVIVKTCKLPKNKDPNDCNILEIEKSIKEAKYVQGIRRVKKEV